MTQKGRRTAGSIKICDTRQDKDQARGVPVNDVLDAWVSTERRAYIIKSYLYVHSPTFVAPNVSKQTRRGGGI